jgi:hypothetical protein
MYYLYALGRLLSFSIFVSLSLCQSLKGGYSLSLSLFLSLSLSVVFSQIFPEAPVTQLALYNSRHPVCIA